MKFLNKLKEMYNVELAYELINYFTDCKYGNIVKKYIKKYSDRQDIFLKAIDLISDIDSPKARYVKAQAYLWSRYPFKLKGIEYAKEYINKELCNELYINILVPQNVEQTEENQKNIHLFSILHEMAIVYQSEYKFDEALKCYDRTIKLTPFYGFAYVYKAKVLIKMDRIQEALSLLKSARLSKYYKPYSTKIYEWEEEQLNDDFKKSIESCIMDIEKKIAKGYKYKSRPSNCIWEKEYYDNLSDLQKKHLQEYIEQGLVKIKEN